MFLLLDVNENRDDLVTVMVICTRNAILHCNLVLVRSVF